VSSETAAVDEAPQVATYEAPPEEAVAQEAPSDEAPQEAEPIQAVQDDVAAEAEGEPEPVAAEADQAEGAGHESDNVLIGVMDPDAANQPVESPWQASEQSSPDTEEQPVAEASSPAEGSADLAPVGLIGETHEGGSTDGQAQDGSDEPVPVATEAQVVMPRSGGAGSWLRWPNGSSDRSDSGQ
jgi:hypothetical protein